MDVLNSYSCLESNSFLYFFREAAKLEIKVLEKIQQRDRNGRRYWYCLDVNSMISESANSNIAHVLAT